MFGGNNNVNRVLSGFIDETQIQYQNNAANQLQLFGNLQDGCSVDLVNFGNEQICSMIPPNNKQSRDLEDISNQQRLQISLNYNARQDEPDRSTSIPTANSISPFAHSTVTSFPSISFIFKTHAIATPNTPTLTAQEAFKGFDIDNDQLNHLPVAVSKDELDISKLQFPPQLVDSLRRRGITNLFPIQRAVLLPAIEGRDIIARARTRTGKMLAFGIPIIKSLTENGQSTMRRSGRLPKVLVLAPTRELAKQVEKEIQESAPYLNTVCVYGGVSYDIQRNALSRGVDVVVGTPGRLIDLINGKSLRLSEIQYLVLDEADQMLAVGFEEDVEVILEKIPSQRQIMLFSATMPGWVKKLSRKHLNNPLTIDLVGDREEKLTEGIKLHANPQPC